MKRTKKFSFGPITCMGLTAAQAKEGALTEAKTALERLAEGTFFGNFENVMFFVQPHICGYEYGFMHNSAGEWAPRTVCGGIWAERPEAIGSVVSHIAQNLYKPGLGSDVPEKAHRYLLQFANSQVATEISQRLQDHFEWHDRYTAAIAAGYNSTEAHQAASGLRPDATGHSAGREVA